MSKMSVLVLSYGLLVLDMPRCFLMSSGCSGPSCREQNKISDTASFKKCNPIFACFPMMSISCHHLAFV